MHGWDGWGMGMGMGWMAMWWTVAALVILVLLWAVLFRTGWSDRGGAETPEQILRRRYASGEIDRDAFLRMLSDLRGEGPPRGPRSEQPA